MNFSCLRLRGVEVQCAVMLLAFAAALHGQTCLTASDMDAPTKTALLNTAQSYFDLVSRGDAATLRQNAIPSLSANFSGIESAVKDNQSTLAGSKAAPRDPYLLQADAGANLERAEFLCGVFGASGQTANSAVFVIPNLPPGTYAVVIEDVTTGKGPWTVSYVLMQQANAWKLGGLYIKAAQVGDHDGNWFAAQARVLKGKGQSHAAWFYFLEARELLVPVSFMSTQATDKLYDESQDSKPADLPPFDLSAGGKTFHVTSLYPLAVDNKINLVVKYDSANVSNTVQTFQENLAVMKAILAKYAELRDIFDGMVARAAEPSGRDYGSMMPMKDIK